MVSVPAVASIYARGQRLWGRIKDERGKWKSISTPYNVGDEENARRYIATGQRSYNARQRKASDGPPTVAEYAEKWLAERQTHDLASFKDDKARINTHVLLHLGNVLMPDVKPRHLRDMVRALRKTELAPRTIRNIYGVAQSMFRDATVDEVIESNPCQLKRDDLPAKIDADPEWRNAATYTLAEVKLMTTDVRVPHPRRIQYALKALAGLRHGEVAGLPWRNYDTTPEPLGLLLVAKSYDGSTKTDVPRRVPVHPELARLLAEWRAAWPSIHDREPAPDDLVVPTKEGAMVSANLAGKEMLRDFRHLGVRDKAGSRHRGGHDLRAWFITTCQECGAHRDILRVITHTSNADVMSGYTRVGWPAMCAEVLKLRLW